MNKVVVYLRVSTDQKTGESQLQSCRFLCSEQGYDVVGIYSDYARSSIYAGDVNFMFSKLDCDCVRRFINIP